MLKTSTPAIRIFSLFIASALIASCNPSITTNRLKQKEPQAGITQIEDDEPIVMELEPTFDPDFIETLPIKRKQLSKKETGSATASEAEIEEDVDSNEPIAYEKREKQIQNKQAQILLEKVKMANVVMKYNPTQRHLTIQGTAEILDENKNKLDETPFTLSGQHSPIDSSFILKSAVPEQTQSNDKPVVRAKVTCLSYDDNDQTNCSTVIIDFFIAYKKKIYTEQMEVKRKTPVEDKKNEVTADATPEATPMATPEPAEVLDENGLQQEGEDNSQLGRYKGQAETADLQEIFENDKDIQDTFKKPEAEVKTEIVPPKVEKEKKEEEKPEIKVITPNVQQTKTGDLRPTNQAIGLPNNGKLRNATSLMTRKLSLDKNAFFDIVFPASQSFYGTYEMAEIITRLGARFNQLLGKKIAVSAISKIKGGLSRPHRSHQNGLDVDMGYPTESSTRFPIVVQMKTRSYANKSYSVEKTYELFKYAFQQTDIKVDRIFSDRKIIQSLCAYAKSKGELTGKDSALVTRMFKNIDHFQGHGSDFHLRLKCSAADPACQEKIYLQNKGCQ